MKVLLFVLLKIAEVAALVGVFYWFKWTGKWAAALGWLPGTSTSIWGYALDGFMIHFAIALVIGYSILFAYAFRAIYIKNWEWVKKIWRE